MDAPVEQRVFDFTSFVVSIKSDTRGPGDEITYADLETAAVTISSRALGTPASSSKNLVRNVS